MIDYKVSIITPYYNVESSEDWLKTMESVSVQNHPNFEWVLVDDGSEAGVQPKIDMSGILIKRVALFNNYGPSVARNVGFQVSDGDIITYVDVGDVLIYDRVDFLRQVFAETRTEVLLSAYTIQREEDTYFFNPHTTFGDKLGEALEEQNVCIPLGIAHIRQAFVTAGGFQPGIVCGEDGILLRRMLVQGYRFGYSDHLAGTYFVTQNGQSRTQRRFEMGGFAFDAEHVGGSHGQYLDEDWFTYFHSRGYME